MATGDRWLDDPAARQRLEDSYNNAPVGQNGLPSEIGGICTAELACLENIGNHEAVEIPEMDGAAFEYHSHPNEGFQRTKNGELVIFEKPARPSADRDLAAARAAKNPYPMYVVAREHIYRVQYNAQTGSVDVSEFNRFK